MTDNASNRTADILFFGDLVGKPGRTVVRHYLETLRADDNLPDVVIANAENVTHGFGLSKTHYDELLEMGVDILTGGNHIMDRKEILGFIDEADQLLVPANFPRTLPGVGHKVFNVGGLKIGVINLIGQVFMGSYNSPWECLEFAIPDLQAQTPIVFIDLHAEATAEKIAMAHYVSTQGVSAMVGTHTHVQTADERILNTKMGFITDAGFNGAYDSVIGMAAENSIMRLKAHIPARLEVGESDLLQLNAVRFTIEVKTGTCIGVNRINERFSKAALPEAVTA